MRSPQDLRDWASVKYRTGHRRWLTASFETLTFATGVPTEHDVGADPDAVAAWVRQWSAFDRGAHPGIEVDWVVRRWQFFGEQRLPARVQVTGAADVASLAGRGKDWSALLDRADQLQAAWPDAVDLPAVIPGLAGRLAALGAEDMPKLVAVGNWFVAHPDSGLLRRQVPVEGVDTKWLERHTDLVERLVAVLAGRGDLGLRVDPRRFRVRLLDPAISPQLPRDFTVPTTELVIMDSPGSWVLICENVQSVVAMPSLPGVVAIHGQGLAVPELAVVPWIAGGRVLYWGDLDTYGFRILSLLRQVLPSVESVLMDRHTLERYASLAVTEPSPYRGDITHLTRTENDALRAIRAADLRLEQERIDIQYAERVVREILDGGS